MCLDVDLQVVGMRATSVPNSQKKRTRGEKRNKKREGFGMLYLYPTVKVVEKMKSKGL